MSCSMKARTWPLRNAGIGHGAKALLLALLALLVAGCTESVGWTEDVRLPDGRVIVLQRYAKLSRQGGGAETYQRIAFTHPTTGKPVIWENAAAVRDRIEGGILSTIALFESDGRMFLLTKPAYGNDDFYFKCPNPPYLLFEHRSDGWISRPLAEIPVQRLRANLTRNVGSTAKREALRRNGGHLGTDQTGNHHIDIRDEKGRRRRVPYIMDFANQPEQTFSAFQGCDQPRNQLVAH